MDLAQTQKILARLCTDSAFRAEFQVDAVRAATALGLTEDEARAAAAIPSAQIDCFAQTLRRKRAEEVRQLLPLTYCALESGFARLFQRHADEYQPSGVCKHRDDALAFGAFLSRQKGNPRWVLDVARYETAQLMAQSRPGVLIRSFACDVASLMIELKRGESIADSPRGRSLAVWLRLGGWARHWVLRFGRNDRSSTSVFASSLRRIR